MVLISTQKLYYICFWASLVAQSVRNLPRVQETQVRSLGQEDTWRKAWQRTPVFLPGESHGQSSLVGYSIKKDELVNLFKHVWVLISFHFYFQKNG